MPKLVLAVYKMDVDGVQPLKFAQKETRQDQPLQALKNVLEVPGNLENVWIVLRLLIVVNVHCYKELALGVKRVENFQVPVLLLEPWDALPLRAIVINTQHAAHVLIILFALGAEDRIKLA